MANPLGSFWDANSRLLLYLTAGSFAVQGMISLAVQQVYYGLGSLVAAGLTGFLARRMRPRPTSVFDGNRLVVRGESPAATRLIPLSTIEKWRFHASSKMLVVCTQHAGEVRIPIAGISASERIHLLNRMRECAPGDELY